jgi:hypothetical protein
MFWSPTENSPDDKPDFRKQFITIESVTVSHASFNKRIESSKEILLCNLRSHRSINCSTKNRLKYPLKLLIMPCPLAAKQSLH